MTSDLIQKLRTCSKEERKAVAMELAHTKSDEAIVELKRMVEGERRYWFNWYKLEDQLIGVEALGETSNRNVLDYLVKIYTPSIMHERRSSSAMCGSDPIYDEWSVEVYSYSLAKYELAKDLSYEIALSTCSWCCETQLDEESIERHRKNATINMESHKIFISSISKLRKDLGLIG